MSGKSIPVETTGSMVWDSAERYRNSKQIILSTSTFTFRGKYLEDCEPNRGMMCICS